MIKATHNVLERFNIENTTQTTITSGARKDKRLAQPIALREAIVNAIVHNDYTSEIPPVFEIFSDRMTLTSYGGLIQGQSIGDFFSFSSMPRSRELMRVFRDVGLVEQLGSGMSRILNAYDRSIFEISDHFVRVTFRYQNQQDHQQDSLQDKILSFCVMPKTRKEIADFCGYKDLRSFAARQLKPLLESGKLSMTIPDKPNSKNQRYVAKN
ncbi:MAG: ATP-binding protein [Clostridia bacterium]|nr:ATP-binding protein [Clostridia bacterium]